MTTILVATDFSTRSDRALRRAVLLARDLAAAIHLVHVVDDDRPERLAALERAAAQDLVDALVETLRSSDGLGATGEVALGEPFEAVGAVARRVDAGLIVLGPYRRRVLHDVFVGTTAQRTIVRTDRPVLLANAVPARPYERIVIATDLSDAAATAATAMRGIGLLDRTAVAFVHVFEAPAEGLILRASVTDREQAAYLADVEARAWRDLDRHLAAIDMTEHSRIVRRADPSVSAAIEGAVAAFEADLVVVGTHGHGGVKRLVLGSVAQDLLSSASVDVCAVPAPP